MAWLWRHQCRGENVRTVHEPGETQGVGCKGKRGELTCTHCPVGLVALSLTWLMVEVLIIAGVGVKAKTVVWT
jgi:hypothetical protein